MFAALGDFEDAAQLAADCGNKYSELVCKEANELLKKNASSEELSQFLTSLKNLGDNEEIRKSIEDIKDKFYEIIYNSAVKKMQSAQEKFSADGYREAEKLFNSVPNTKNSTELADICDYNAKVIKFNMIISELQLAYDETSIEKCRQKFLSIENFDMANEMVQECEKQAKSISRLNELKKLLLTLECSNDIDALNEAKRKALDMNGIGNSTQIARECEQKIACINSGTKFVPNVRSASIVRDDILTLKAELKIVSFNSKTKSAKMPKAPDLKAKFNAVSLNGKTESAPDVFCRKCGNRILADDTRFCSYCGTEI